MGEFNSDDIISTTVGTNPLEEMDSMFSYRAALLVNEIMTTTFFELFELRNSK